MKLIFGKIAMRIMNHFNFLVLLTLITFNVNASYVGGDPMSKIDPTGLSDISIFDPNTPNFIADMNMANSPGFFSLAGHGTADSMFNQLSGLYMSPQRAAEMIRSNPAYKSGQPVQLNSCSTGGATSDGSSNFAQELSSIMGVLVLAPNDILYLTLSGRSRIGGTNQWNRFQPSAIPFR